jgi:hypothetical protein
MHANDLPVVGQALSPANRIIYHLLSEGFPAKFRGRSAHFIGTSRRRKCYRQYPRWNRQ